MIEVRPEGLLLLVKAQPGARRNGVRGQQAGMLKVSVTQVAERGKANQAIINVLCEALDLRKSQIELYSGETSAEKKFLIREVDVEQLAKRIEIAIAQGK